MKAISRFRFATTVKVFDPQGTAERIKRLNEAQKRVQETKKDEKLYIQRMSPERIEKIGAQTLLDKHWAEKPLGVIKNPHKLTEVELY
jgi:hypothetical protein